MGKNDEYLRLPHGMFDREADWVRRERQILSKHDEIGRRIGCEVKKYTPLGYSETYQRGTNAANDKVYKFDSKTGKSLMLSSDSTPSIFREYLASGESKSKRIAFVAPLFRYRNSHSRHFTQIGYAIINEKKDENDIDTKIVELGKGMVNLFDSMGIKINIYLNNYEALKQILAHDVSEEKMSEILYQLQFASEDERLKFFKENIKDSKRREQLMDLFTRKPTQIIEYDEKNNYLNLPDEYIGIYRIAEGLKTVANVDVIFDPTNLHSIETLDNYAMRFTTLNGSHLGDGGEYTSYAKRFDDRISSYWSVASGVEAISRNTPLEIEQASLKKLALLNTDASALFALQTIKKLEDLGFAVVYQGNNIKIGKAIKKLDEDYTYLSIIGKDEEMGGEIKIKDLNTRNEVNISDLINESQEITEKNKTSQESSETIKDIIKVMRNYFETGDFDREKLLEIIASHST